MTIENILTNGLKTSIIASPYKAEYDENLVLLDKNRITSGLTASRPVASKNKRFWFDPVTHAISFDDGNTWHEDVFIRSNQLSVESTSAINQDLTTDADVSFASVTTDDIAVTNLLVNGQDADDRYMQKLPIGSTIMFDASGWQDNNTILGWYACISANAAVGCPDLVNKFLMGSGIALRGAIGGSNSKTILVSELPSHSHNLSSHSHTVNSHSHVVNSHSHTVNSHTHGGGNHTHTINHSHSQGTTNPTSLTHFHQAFSSVVVNSNVALTASNYASREHTSGGLEGYSIKASSSESNIGRTSTFNDNHTHTFNAPTFSGSSGGGSATTAATAPGTNSATPGTSSVDSGTGGPSNNTSGSTGSGSSYDSRPSYYSIIYIRRCT